MSVSTTMVSGRSRVGEKGQSTGCALRPAALFTMLVTGPYSLLLLVAVFVSVARTGQAFYPDLTTRDGLAYAAQHTTAVQFGYLADGLSHVCFLITFMAVFAALRVRWPIWASLLLVGATWQFVIGVTKALTSFYTVGNLAASYLAANATGRTALLPLGGVVDGLRQGLQAMDTYGVQAVWVLIAFLPRETGIPNWIRWLGLLMAVAFLSPFGPVAFVLVSLLIPAWALVLGRWLVRQSAGAQVMG